MILDPLIGGIAMGCIYSLIALGYNMLIRAMNLLHFAQGEVMMVGALSGVTLVSALHVPYLVGGGLMVALQLFFTRSLVGIAMRAAAQDRETARLMGIDIDRTIQYTFAISGAVGGIVFGVIETFAALFISSGYKDALGYGVMIAILLVAPSGLFGRRVRA